MNLRDQEYHLSVCCSDYIDINSAAVETVHLPSCNHSFIRHLMAVLKLLNLLGNSSAAVAVCLAQLAMHFRDLGCTEITVCSAFFFFLLNRYAIPPEHGKRLERLATGKRIIYIAWAVKRFQSRCTVHS